MNKIKFWMGITLVFFGGARFLSVIFLLLAWDFVLQSFWSSNLYWINQWLFLGLGWGEAYLLTWIGVKLLKEASK